MYIYLLITNITSERPQLKKPESSENLEYKKKTAGEYKN